MSKRILALDGGGIRGALTLGYLVKIEALLQERHNNPNLRLCDYFDLIGGTSTGAIIAGGLAIGKSAKEMKDLYMAMGDKIFGKKRKWYDPKYYKATFDFTPLERGLTEVFGDITLGDDRIKTGLCIVTKRADTYSTWPFINHPEAKYYKDNKDILLRKLIRASAAAPTYFVPQILQIAPGQMGAFVDGGVSQANNPALQLFMFATLKELPYQWPLGDKELMVVSLGTGTYTKRTTVEKMANSNLLNWAKNLPEMFMADANFNNQMILQYLSSSPTAIEIDGEVGTLGESNLWGKNALHYLRYNTLLEENTLNELKLSKYVPELDRIRDMANPHSREKLFEIGFANAERQIKAEHFPADFDL